jgi:nondiscriminating aspartyl-tRNA synthetase
MISRVLAADLPSHVGAQVCIAGWLHRRRQLKSMTFLVIRDRSGLAQVVLSSAEQVAAAAELPEETVVAVAGTVVASD